MPLAILYHEKLKEYDFGPGHPFRGDRYDIFPRFLQENLEPADNYRFLKAEPVNDHELQRICQSDYINFTREYYRAANLGLEYNGDFSRYQSMDNRPAGRPGKLEEAARLVVGQAKMAADLVQAGEYPKVVSIGGGLHHAQPNYGEGFCLYNDVAFTAIYLLEQYGLERVLVLDTDAHAGNGTMNYFSSSAQVLFVDLHQDPRTLYPGTGFSQEIGTDDGRGYTVNVPMPVNAGDESYRLVFDDIVAPLASEFQPQIIIRNGGSDPHYNDGLTNLGMTLDGFRFIGEQVRTISESCQGRVIDLITSGYNRDILPYAWMNMISGLADFPVVLEEATPVPRQFQQEPSLESTRQVISQVKQSVGEYWQCFHR